MKGKALISFGLSLGILAVSSIPVFAQQQSERYPTATEMQRVRDQFRQMIQSTSIKDRRTQNQKQARESFVRTWSKVDAAVAPFLGTWSGAEESTSIYPSNTKGRVCLIWNGEATGSLSIGTVSNSQIRTRDRSVFFKEGNYLGIATVKNNKADVTVELPLNNPRTLQAAIQLPINNKQEKARIIQEFNAAGCTASLLSKQQNQKTDEANRRIQNLPDGNYYYGESLVPNSSGSDYLIFRKKGNKVTGMRYPVPGETSCFTGTASSGAITNVTVEFMELGEGGKRELLRGKDIDLGSYYKLRFNQAPGGGTKFIQECTKVFPI